MSLFFAKHIRSLASSPYSNNLFYFFRIHLFCAKSTSLKSIDSFSDKSSFTVKYLINSCGLTPERALWASKYVKFDIADKPNSVLSFFKDHGFTHTQISKLINSNPNFLESNPERTFLPKIEFLKSKGFSSLEVAAIVSRSSEILRSSLKNYLIPSFNIYRNFFPSDEKTIAAFKNFAGTRWMKNAKHVEINIEMLKQIGVPIKNIRSLMIHQPKIFSSDHDRFRQSVEEVTKLGYNPLNTHFVIAIKAFNLMSKSTLDKKVEVYKRWGWSEEEIAAAFRKNPWCMIVSENKIVSVMEFWVNKMGWKSSLLAERPNAIIYSLEKRVEPRCEVYRFLVSNDLIKPAFSKVATMLNYSEKGFQEKYINPYKEEAADLLKLYKQKLDLAK